MEFTLSSRTRGLLIQIREAIFQLKDWNKGIHCSDDYYCSPDGMKNLAASCMLIEAIGEGIKPRVLLDNVNSIFVYFFK